VKNINSVFVAAATAFTLLVIVMWVRSRSERSDGAAPALAASSSAELVLAAIESPRDIVRDLEMVLAPQNEYQRLGSVQQNKLSEHVAAILTVYGSRSSDRLVEYMKNAGARLRTNTSEAEIEKTWCSNPDRFPWSRVRIDQLTVAPIVRDSRGVIIHESPGEGVLSRGCYSSFEFDVDMKKLVREGRQIYVTTPMLTFDGIPINVIWRLVWWETRQIWVPLDMTQQGDGRLGLPKAVM